MLLTLVLFLQLTLPFQKLDAHVEQTPSSTEINTDRLVAYLIKPAKNDDEKAYVIYSWIAKNVQYDVRAYRRGIRSNRDENVLKYRLAVCEGYASLFDLMAKKAGLKTKIVTGRARGSSDSKSFIPHAWNAVQTNGKWHLIDATWGSGSLVKGESQFQPEFDRHYFYIEPSVLIASHLPDEDSWQLLDKPVTEADVSSMIQGSSDYYKWQIKPLSHLKNEFDSQGFEKISIKVPNSIYVISQLENARKQELSNEYSIVIRKDEYIEVLVSFPSKGEYKLTLYGKDNPSEASYGNLFTYMIHAKKGNSNTFPKTFESYVIHPFNLISPSPTSISSRDSVLFDMESTAFKRMVIFNGEQAEELKADGTRYFKKMKLNRGKAQIGGSTKGDEHFEILMEFVVN
ncbi:hypothetical protein EP331_03475 [bacterium]|nr:MAG: hypothetical protein EP331_03475 [bacterium]